MTDRTEFEAHLSPFAHPLPSGAELRSQRSWKVVASTTALCLAVGIGAVLIVAWANRRPVSGSSAAMAPRRISIAPATSQQTLPAGNASGQASEETRPSLAYYTQNVHGGLFSPPLPPAPRFHRAAYTPPPQRVPPPPDDEPTILPVTPVNPFVDWSYDGTVKIGPREMALLENVKTREGQFVQKGDTFLDARVARITEQRVTLRTADKTYTLPKSQKITVVPLDKSAPYLTQKPTQPAVTAPASPTATPPLAAAAWAAYTPAQRAMLRQYWRQYRRMYGGARTGPGGYYLGTYQPNPPGGQ